jgi:hypothetical protein
VSPSPFPERSRILYRGQDTINVANTTTESEIAGIDLPPAITYPTRAFRVQVQGLYTQNGGVILISDPIIRVKLGTTTLWTSPALWLSGLRSIFAAPKMLWLQVFLSNPGASNVQHLNVWTWMDTLGNGAAFGVANLTVDTSKAQRFSITWQHPRANAGLTFQSLYRIGEII